MRGGYRYRSSSKKSLRMRHNSRRVTAGRKMTKRKMTKRNKHKRHNMRRHRKKSRRHNRKQSGGMAPFNEAYPATISERLSDGPHLNTVQDYSADLNHAPIMGHSTVTQCENP